MGKKSKKRRAKDRAARAKREASTRPVASTEAQAHSGTHEVEAPAVALTEGYGDTPEASEEHRVSARVSVAVDIHMASESHFFSGLSGDISEGGLFLSTYRSLSIGHEVDLEFSLPGEKDPVHARGEVRWLREHSAHEPRGVGIAFGALAEADRDKIHRFCTIRPPLYYDDVG